MVNSILNDIQGYLITRSAYREDKNHIWFLEKLIDQPLNDMPNRAVRDRRLSAFIYLLQDE